MILSQDLLAKYPSLLKLEGKSDEEIVESHDGREVSLLKSIYDNPNLDSDIRGNPDAILRAIDDFAMKEEFLINIGPHKASLLESLIRANKPRVIVELGGYVGYSAILFGKILRSIYPVINNNNNNNNNNSQITKVYSLEMDPLVASIAMNLVSLAGLSDIVEVVVGSAAHTIRRLHANGTFLVGGIDLLFLDHVEDLYEADLNLCEELGLLKPCGGLVVADNVLIPGAPKYREYVRGNERFKSWALKGLIIPGDLEDELEISIVN